jgi:respiratory burst oxidase
LFIALYAILIFHPWPGLPYKCVRNTVPNVTNALICTVNNSDNNHGDTWLWISAPLLIFIIEKILRYMRQKYHGVKVLEAKLLSGDVIKLVLEKPANFSYDAGSYLFLNLPSLCIFEWHPFTITSTKYDDFVSVHMRATGDWTKTVSTILGRDPKYDDKFCCGFNMLANKKCNLEMPIFSIDGPFGAPATNAYDHSRIILVGAGIGVTPFASIVREICGRLSVNSNSMTASTRKLIQTCHINFIFTCRSLGEAGWFGDIMEQLKSLDTTGILDINIHVTGTLPTTDLRSAMLLMAQKLILNYQKGWIFYQV